MKRRVCESCLYFESAGFSKNGWCHHPSRRHSPDIRLIVRANELGCRNGWDVDLWVPADDDSTQPSSRQVDERAGRVASEVVTADASDMLTSIVAAKTDNRDPANAASDLRPLTNRSAYPSLQEDVIVEQSPSLSWKQRPHADQPASELVQNPKAAILRARDQFRQRRKAEGRLADRYRPAPAAPLVASTREAQHLDPTAFDDPDTLPAEFDPVYENRPLLQPAPSPSPGPERPISPVSLREIDRSFPTMTEFPEDRARYESIPQIDRSSISADTPVSTEPDDRWIETRQLDSVLPEPYVIDDLFEEAEFAETGSIPADDIELSVRHRESILDRFLRQRRERKQEHPKPAPNGPIAPAARYDLDEDAHVLEPVAAEPVAPHASGRSEQSHVEVTGPARRTQRTAWRPNDSVPSYEDFVLPPPLPPAELGAAATPRRDPAPSLPAVDRVAANGRRSERSSRESRPLAETPIDEFGDRPLFEQSSPPPISFDDRLVDDQDRIAPTTAPFRADRICQTCRDFRPADNGERGWCNNKWAFDHRRMVDADDLACRNSLGSWWTPKDDYWRRDGDISRHAQQTPRVDQWLFGLSSSDHGRRRSGS